MKLVELNKPERYMQQHRDKLEKIPGDNLAYWKETVWTVSERAHQYIMKLIAEFIDKWKGYNHIDLLGGAIASSIPVNKLFVVSSYNASHFRLSNSMSTDPNVLRNQKYQKVLNIVNNDEFACILALLDGKQKFLSAIVQLGQNPDEIKKSEYFKELVAFMEAHYDRYIADVKKILKATEDAFDEQGVEAGLSKGMDPAHYKAMLNRVMDFIHGSTEGGIPDEIKIMANKALVNPAMLPKSVYRGMFIKADDPDHLRDLRSIWSGKPNVRFERPSSWSANYEGYEELNEQSQLLIGYWNTYGARKFHEADRIKTGNKYLDPIFKLFQKYNRYLDLGPANIMRRGDQAVIIDPFFGGRKKLKKR